MNIASNSNHFPSVSSAINGFPNRQAGRADRSKFNDEPWGDHGGFPWADMELSPPKQFDICVFTLPGREMGRSRFLSSIFFFHQRKSYFGKNNCKRRPFFFHEKVVLYQKNTHTQISQETTNSTRKLELILKRYTRTASFTRVRNTWTTLYKWVNGRNLSRVWKFGTKKTLWLLRTSDSR